MIDIILSWPRNTDFPLWRQWIRDYRQLFQKVIVVFTETNQGEDYRAFLRSAMTQDITFIDIQSTPPGKDWRDVAVNKGLEISTSEWVWFTEQDFLFTKNGTIEELFKDADKFKKQRIAYYDNGRMHPCCIFARRDLIEKTSKNFGIVPNVLDHFGLFQQETERLDKSKYDIRDEYVYHMNGLTHNMNLVYNGGEPNYKPEEFKQYLVECLLADVPLDERFFKLAKGYLNV